MEKPKCKLVGEDGNVFAIIGKVTKTLKDAELLGKAREFSEKAFASNSYNEVLNLAMEYCDVE